MNSQQNFWDFVQSFDPNQGHGRGVDHSGPQFPPGFPSGDPRHHGPAGPHPPPGPQDADFEWGPWFHGPAGPWGPPGRRGPHGRFPRDDMNHGESREDEGLASGPAAQSDEQQETNNSPDTMRADAPDPAEVIPEDEDRPRHHRGCGRGRGRGHRGAGRCGRGGFPHGPRFGPHHGPGAFPGAHHPPPPGQGPPFDFGGFLRGWANYPFFRNLRDQAQRFQSQSDNADSFAPPVDIFNTERAYVLHVALPGAKKEEIGVNWDADNGVLNIAGVIHRPGDEEFLSTITSSERKVGMFERNVTLPPEGSAEKDEIDGFAINAKMEDGVLIVTVPKLEKEWTEIRKVDIE